MKFLRTVKGPILRRNARSFIYGTMKIVNCLQQQQQRPFMIKFGWSGFFFHFEWNKDYQSKFHSFRLNEERIILFLPLPLSLSFSHTHTHIQAQTQHTFSPYRFRSLTLSSSFPPRMSYAAHLRRRPLSPSILSPSPFPLLLSLSFFLCHPNFF